MSIIHDAEKYLALTRDDLKTETRNAIQSVTLILRQRDVDEETISSILYGTYFIFSNSDTLADADEYNFFIECFGNALQQEEYVDLARMYIDPDATKGIVALILVMFEEHPEIIPYLSSIALCTIAVNKYVTESEKYFYDLIFKTERN